MSFVEERYQEESIDVSRPLMRPEDYLYQIQEIQSYIDSSKQIAFASANTLIDTTKDKEIQLKELVKKQKNAELACSLITSSEQTKLDEINKKYKINTTTIPFNIRDEYLVVFTHQQDHL